MKFPSYLFFSLFSLVTSINVLTPNKNPPQNDPYWNTWQPKKSTTKWRTSDRIVIYKDKPFYIRGVSFNGIESNCRAPLGLFDRSLSFFLDSMKSMGINAIRLPVSYEVMADLSLPIGCVDAEPRFWNGMQIGDLIQTLLDEANARQIKVLVDLHTINGKITPLPWTDSVSEDDVVRAWVNFLNRFGKHESLMGIEIKNEPHEPCSMEQFLDHCAKVIFNVNTYLPDFQGLFFISGIQIASPWGGAYDSRGLSSFMGINHPSAICMNNTVDRYVLSPHTYGPDVRGQDAAFENEDTWEKYYGFITNYQNHFNETPIVNTEYGGYMREGSSDRAYFKRWLAWTMNKNMKAGGFMWTFAPFSSDTGGLLTSSYDVDQYKLDFLRQFTPNPTFVK